MIIIELTEDWRIQSDPYSWSLAKRVKCKPSLKRPCIGGYEWIPQNWHRTLSDAGNHFIDQELRKSDATGHREASERRDQLKALVDHALGPFGALADADASLRKHERG